MDHVAPAGPVYQAGTLSGNPLAMAAGIAMLDSLTPAAYAKLERTAAKLEKGMRKVAKDLGFEERLTLNRIGSILTLFFNPGPIADFDDVKKSDGAAFNRWFHGLLKRGVFIAPAAFEAMFVSTAHTEKDLERTRKAHREALKEAFAAA